MEQAQHITNVSIKDTYPEIILNAYSILNILLGSWKDIVHAITPGSEYTDKLISWLCGSPDVSSADTAATYAYILADLDSRVGRYMLNVALV